MQLPPRGLCCHCCRLQVADAAEQPPHDVTLLALAHHLLQAHVRQCAVQWLDVEKVVDARSRGSTASKSRGTAVGPCVALLRVTALDREGSGIGVVQVPVATHSAPFVTGPMHGAARNPAIEISGGV